MTRFRTHCAAVTISAALALTLDAVPAVAYQQLSREVLVDRSPTAADDLPAPPKMAGAPKAPKAALNGYGRLTMNGTHVGNLPSAPSGRGLGARIRTAISTSTSGSTRARSARASTAFGARCHRRG
jgi:hypothetical protein